MQTAASVAEAMPLLLTLPNYVILDLMLPDGNGITLLEWIRAGAFPIKVAVTTGSNDQEHLDGVMRLRPEALLKKPIKLLDLLNGLGVNP